MSISELKKIVDETSDEGRIFLAAYLRHARRRNDPAHRANLDRLCDDAASGKRYSLARARELNEKLESGDVLLISSIIQLKIVPWASIYRVNG